MQKNDLKGFVKSYTVGNDEEKKKIFGDIKKEMAVTKGPKTITYIRGPFSQWGKMGAQAKRQQMSKDFGDQVCICTNEKAEQIEHFWNANAFIFDWHLHNKA